MLQRRRWTSGLARVLAVGGVVALLAGCGGGASKDEYVAGLERVQTQMDAATKASNEANGIVDAKERATALGAAHDALAKAAATAAKLDPPDDVAKQQAAFAKALEDYADLFGRLAALPPDDPSEPELYAEAGEIVQRLQDASASIEKAGYEVDRG